MYACTFVRAKINKIPYARKLEKKNAMRIVRPSRGPGSSNVCIYNARSMANLVPNWCDSVRHTAPAHRWCKKARGLGTTAPMVLRRAEFSQKPLLFFHVALASRGLAFISLCLAVRESDTTTTTTTTETWDKQRRLACHIQERRCAHSGAKRGY